MTDPTTWRISQLTEWVNAVVSSSLGGEIWVEGEISNLQRSAAGHVYFTLVERDEPGDGSPSRQHTLAVTLFEWHRVNVNRHLRRTGGNVRMGDGVRVRIRGTVEVYSPRSQLQLRMTGIDPVFTLGSMAIERARVLASLEADGLLDAQARLDPHPLPLRLAVVTSIGSAAHADVIHELSTSGIGFDVTVLDARVQGNGAPASLISAIERAELLDVDLVVVARGGGARTDLVTFDDERVARAIATCPIPVWVGLGHEIDRTVCDEVAQRSFKTPTACADAVVDTVTTAAGRLEETWGRVLDATGSAMRRASVRLGSLATRVATGTEADLRRADRTLVGASVRLGGRGNAVFDAAANRLGAFERSLVRRPRNLVDGEERRLGRIEDLVRAYDPATALERGWSITRTESGRLASASTLRPGEVLVTKLADGVVRSRVDETFADADQRGVTT